MKKIIFLSITAALIISSCSKEELPVKQQDNFIFFKLATSADSLFEFGYIDNGVPGGPSMYTQTKGDSIFAMLFHNPSHVAGWITPRLDLRKKDISVIGRYVYQEFADPVASFMWVSHSSPTLSFIQQSLIVDIEKIGTHPSFGKYVEGKFTGRVLKDFNSTVEIPAWGNFRVMYK